MPQHGDEFVPVDGTKLPRQERAEALGALMFLTQKRDGNTKARKYAYGMKQHGTINKGGVA